MLGQVDVTAREKGVLFVEAAVITPVKPDKRIRGRLKGLRESSLNVFCNAGLSCAISAGVATLPVICDGLRTCAPS